MYLPYQLIKERCEYQDLVFPWHEKTLCNGMSYGLGPAGYDVRIKQSVYLKAGGFHLASTIEHFNMPDDIIATVCDKSSWARIGVCVQNTVIEPGWRGYLTIEITNHTQYDRVIHAGSPICQILFCFLAEPTQMPYDGKYQDQADVEVPAIFEGEA